jgi:ribosome-associated translation inhibitor RaiA
MNIQVKFRDIEKLEHLEAFVETRFGDAVSTFLDERYFELTVRLNTERHRSELHRPTFRCEAVLHVFGRRNPIVIQKESRNFLEAVARVEHALTQQLRREVACTSRRRAEKRRPYELEAGKAA